MPPAPRRARPDLLPGDAAAPAGKRPYVHALYGFARYADEIVDDLGSTPARRREGGSLALEGSAGRSGRAGGPTGRCCRPSSTDPRAGRSRASHFEDFLGSMRMDLTVTEYGTYEDLALLRLGLGCGDRAADGADAGADLAARAAADRTRSTSASRSSWRTSSATSARTSRRAASTCRRSRCAPVRRRPRAAGSRVAWGVV